MSKLFAERGGKGERLLVLLHGLGATAAVWHPFIEVLDREWNGRWLAPDFRGHGRSMKEGPYNFEQHAKDVGALTAQPIRCRGWLDLFDGPRIDVTHPEQIEVLET